MYGGKIKVYIFYIIALRNRFLTIKLDLHNMSNYYSLVMNNILKALNTLNHF